MFYIQCVYLYSVLSYFFNIIKLHCTYLVLPKNYVICNLCILPTDANALFYITSSILASLRLAINHFRDLTTSNSIRRTSQSIVVTFSYDNY